MVESWGIFFYLFLFFQKRVPNMNMHRIVITMICAHCVVPSLVCMQKEDHAHLFNKMQCIYVSQEFAKKLQPHHDTCNDSIQDLKKDDMHHVPFIDYPNMQCAPTRLEEKKQESNYIMQKVYSFAGWAKSLVSSQPEKSDVSEYQLLDANNFDWQNPYVLKKQLRFYSGFKNYLQWYENRKDGIELYDVVLRELIIKKAPVMDAWWTDNNSCYCITRKREGAEPEALIYDFKQRAVHRVAPCTGYFHEKDRFFGRDEHVRFVTVVNDALHITHIRPQRETYPPIFRKDCEIVRSFFCDTHLWVLYKNTQNLKQTMIVYDIKKRYEILKEISVDGRVVRPWDYLYTAPKDKNYLPLCIGDMLYVYDMTTAECVYQNKQRPSSPNGLLTGAWNQSGSRYAITNDLPDGFVTTHDLNNERSFELYRVNDNPIRIASGFQNQYVSVVVRDGDNPIIFRFYDSFTGEAMTTFCCEGAIRSYGYGAQYCYWAFSSKEFVIFNFIANTMSLRLSHDNNIIAVGGSTQDLYYALSQEQKLLLIDIMNTSYKAIDYHDPLHRAHFNGAGDKLMVAYGHKVDILKSQTAEIETTLDLKEFTASTMILSPKGTICAVLLKDDATIVNIYNAQTGAFITSLGYCDDVKTMRFDAQETVFVVTTQTETRSYSVKNNFQEIK